jgi:hypothetical protein
MPHDKDTHAPRAPTESAYFPVALFVAVVGDGVLDSHTPPRVLERLQQASSKVPKEQIIRIVLRDKASGGKSHALRPGEKDKDGKEVQVKLRVFVSNSEDAKAVQGYIASHEGQTPAPMVVLCPTLPMAMEYDSLTVDPSNQGTADRLRKQAKTRAVKLVRELLVENSEKLTRKLLFGHAGPTAPVKLLADSLKRRTSVINTETQERGIVYTAGCKPVNASAVACPVAALSVKVNQMNNDEYQEDEDEDEEDEDEEEEEEEEVGAHKYEQGLESLLALASQALQDAAKNSASSTPAALPIGQWQEGEAREAGDSSCSAGNVVVDECDVELMRLGKRKKLPAASEDGVALTAV